MLIGMDDTEVEIINKRIFAYKTEEDVNFIKLKEAYDRLNSNYISDNNNDLADLIEQLNENLQLISAMHNTYVNDTDEVISLYKQQAQKTKEEFEQLGE